METKDAAKSAKRRFRAFTAEEKAALRDYVNEGRAGANPEAEVLAKIAEMQPADRAMAEKIHQIVKSAAPQLTARTWYGMPAYAKDGDVICFFQPGHKFKTRYGTLGFNNKAKLDEGSMWPTAYALTEMNPQNEKRIRELIRRAAG